MMKEEIVIVKKGITEQPKSKISISSILVHTVMVLLAASVILPLTIPFFFVFKTNLEFAYHPWSWPQQLLWDNFKIAWDSVRIDRGMINTFIVCLGAVLVTVPTSAMAGYIFSKYNSRLTNVLFYLIMIVFFIPAQMVLIPLYRIESAMHLINTLPGLFLVIAAFNIPLWTMIYRSFFSGLPGDLMEAAKIDGASHWQIFYRIMFPLAKPATVFATLLVFMAAWSDYLLSLIFINSQNLFTIQLLITQFIGNLGANFYPQFAAGIIIGTTPTVILYILFHKKIIEGTTLSGAIKG